MHTALHHLVPLRCSGEASRLRHNSLRRDLEYVAEMKLAIQSGTVHIPIRVKNEVAVWSVPIVEASEIVKGGVCPIVARGAQLKHVTQTVEPVSRSGAI